jgi:hypothetical protein
MKKLIAIGIILALVAVGALSGCVTTGENTQDQTSITSSPIFQVAVQYAVMRFVAESPERQAEALRIVNTLQEYIDGSETITVKILREMTTSWVPWEKLHPADQFLLQQLIVQVAAYLENMVGSGSLDDNARTLTRDFLGWISEAVSMGG